MYKCFVNDWIEPFETIDPDTSAVVNYVNSWLSTPNYVSTFPDLLSYFSIAVPFSRHMLEMYQHVDYNLVVDHRGSVVGVVDISMPLPLLPTSVKLENLILTIKNKTILEHII